MLNDNPMIEGTSGEVHITDFTADVIENLLSFMYNDIVDKKNINCDLLKAANKYLMEGLKNICSEYLSGTVFQREVLEFPETNKGMGRFGHCVMPAGQICQSIQKRANSRTAL